MPGVAIGDFHSALRVRVVDDENLAGRSTARLLITASTTESVERLARRVHGAGMRACFPFVHTSARALAVHPEELKEQCGAFLDCAAGGSLLISGVEEMPWLVQHAVIDWLATSAYVHPSTDVRIMSGTTESLLERVRAGAFSERLFYQLNTIHLIAQNRLAHSDDCGA